MDSKHDKQGSTAGQKQPEQQSQAQQPPPITNEAKDYIRMRYKQGQEAKAAQRKRDFEDRRTRITEMLLPDNRDKPVVISTLDEYLAMDAAYKSLSAKTDIDEQTMEDYPETDAEWAAHTARLAAAITDFTDVFDKPQKNLSGDGNTAVNAVKSLSTFEVQLLAGRILTATRDAHAGRYNIPSWPKAWKRDWYPSFQGRFEEICNALTHSKAIVKSIMDAEFPFAMRFATAPYTEFKMKKDNKALNDKRAETKQEMKKRIREGEDNGNDTGDAASQEDPGVQESKPRKRPNVSAARNLQHLSFTSGPSQSSSAGSSNVST